MAEYDLNNFSSDNEPENKETAAAENEVNADYISENSAPQSEIPEPVKAESAEAGELKPEKKYEDVYSSSADYNQPVYSGYMNPYSRTDAEKPRTETNQDRVNPYADSASYRPQSYQNRDASYGDGYYHRSFANDSSGNNVNYTASRYSQPTQQQSYQAPRTAQPNQQAPISQQQTRAKEKRSGGISKGGIALLLVVCLLISAAAGFGGSLLANQLNKNQYDSTDSETMVIHKVNAEAQVASTENLVDKATDQIASEVADTVVEITTEVMQTNSFYGQYIAQGAGSGVIISEDGYIVTNNHVIDGASSITVTTRSGDSYEAKLIGTDPEVDVAIIKVEATGLPTAVFGDSSTLEVGDKAVIIGNPLGTLGGSVTEGIISALDRSIVIDGKTMHLMQTDAAINPGNSGGGMFNGQGELAGIVVAKSSSSSESIDNIGFVIPINSVLDILGDLKDYGYVRGRADTGMSFIDLSNQMYAWYYYGNSSAGVYISSVESGSNADKAGFREGDRVISVDGKEITSADDIDAAIKDKSVGDTVKFELERSGSKGTLELELEEYKPTSESSSKNNSSSDDGFGNNPFGFGR